MAVDPAEIPLERIRTFLAAAEVETFELRLRDGSPWVEFGVWVHLMGARRFALWTRNGKIYAVADDGVVDEDPVESLVAAL